MKTENIPHKGELVKFLLKDLNSVIDLILEKNKNKYFLADLKRVINSAFISYEFGLIARRTIEFTLDDIIPESERQLKLIKQIETIGPIENSIMIQSYFHLIRIYGNEAAFNPRNREEDIKDLEIMIQCMIKILNFYHHYKPGNTVDR